MGFEYQITVTAPNRIDRSGLKAGLLATGRYHFVEENEDQLSFSYAQRSPRSWWPEDVVLFYLPSGIRVLFHTGTLEQRRRALDDLSSPLE